MKNENTPQNPRHYRWHDHLLITASQCIRTLSVLPSGLTSMTRPNPSDNVINPETLTAKQSKDSASMMRVNHTGEVCAQALYLGQSWTTSNPELRTTFKNAASEEADHLQWCAQRLAELDSHTSYLNPLWFTGSLIIGSVAGFAGDRWSLGFLAQTEQQVYEHLGKHLAKLPAIDQKSRAIVEQMQQDEAKHETTAVNLGAALLPWPIKIGMRLMAKVMTSVAKYI